MKRLLSIALLVFGIVVVGASGAHADAVLTLTSGLDVVSVADGSLLDGNLLAGAVTYIGAVGPNWIVNVSTGLTKPLMGSAALPEMDLNSVDLSLGAGTLTIEWTDDGFGPQTGTTYNMGIGGTTAGTVIFSAGLDSHDNFGTVGPMAGGLGGSFAGAFSGDVTAIANPYSLTEFITIVHTAGGTTSFDASLTNNVPEPSALLLLGSGLAALGFWTRRRS